MKFLHNWIHFLTWAEVLVVWKKKIVRGQDGPIMSQMTLLGILGWHLRLHFFHRGDGEVFHDHPRGFLSVCLFGAYQEQLLSSHRIRFVQRGTITIRKATDAHNVTPIRFPCVTLTLTTPVVRVWKKFECE